MIACKKRGHINQILYNCLLILTATGNCKVGRQCFLVLFTERAKWQQSDYQLPSVIDGSTGTRYKTIGTDKSIPIPPIPPPTATRPLPPPPLMALSYVTKDPSSEFVVCTRTRTTLVIVNKREWLWSPTSFFVICFFNRFWPWRCTSHNRFGKMLEQLTNKNYSTRSVNVKEKIGQGCGPCNINCSTFVITFKVPRFL